MSISNLWTYYVWRLSPLFPQSVGLKGDPTDANNWSFGPVYRTVNYSTGMPAHPSQFTVGWGFEVPQSDGVHYVQMPCGSLANAKKIKIKYRVEGLIVPSNG